ncbi:hypothetical protein [Thermocrinis minervae]|uniref:hypothetical protein n=1 Tax=Thermocrinis minervae TaxID=381751 RepID=UPI0015618C1B|nr:hypothetical protein [Thermocrinis minervae]
MKKWLFLLLSLAFLSYLFGIYVYSSKEARQKKIKELQEEYESRVKRRLKTFN